MGPPHMLQKSGWKKNSLKIGEADRGRMAGWRATAATARNARRVKRTSTGEVLGAATSAGQTGGAGSAAGAPGAAAASDERKPALPGEETRECPEPIALGLARRPRPLHGQQAAPPGGAQRPARARRQHPRRAGRTAASVSPARPKDVGNWDGPANASIFFNIVDGKKVTPAASLPTNKTVDEIPFKPGVRALYDSRGDQADDPHTRCKPSGGSRFWHTPYGIEIVDLPETQGSDLPARRRAAQLARRIPGWS